MPRLAAAHRIITLLTEASYETRLVGGWVRDGLLGIAAEDMDLATTATPPQMMAVLENAGIKTIPTGIAFGTVLAVLGEAGIEITTLRRDIKTDGRHAEVVFTTDWQADAARRDFTINALSQDLSGKIYDYCGGIADLQAGRVRFVGDAAARLAEDHLRLLRFFRFYAHFGKVPPDTATLEACHAAATTLPRLSRERVWKELKRLLIAANPAPAWQLMVKHGIIQPVLPEAIAVPKLEKLLAGEAAWHAPAHTGFARRLVALLATPPTLPPLPQRLALSRAEATLLGQLQKNPFLQGQAGDALQINTSLYRHGACLTRDFLLLAYANGQPLNWDYARTLLETWHPHPLPINGLDLKALGVAPGRQMGEILAAVEQWWISQAFQPDKAACLAFAEESIQAIR